MFGGLDWQFGGSGWFSRLPSTRTRGSSPQTTNPNDRLVCGFFWELTCGFRKLVQARLSAIHTYEKHDTV